MKAPDSDSWLVEHRYTRAPRLPPDRLFDGQARRCPHCGAKDSLVSIGPGVERVEEEARLRFPDARMAVFSSDTVTDARAAREMIEAMADGRVRHHGRHPGGRQGTQFPWPDPVGVVDGDLGLSGGDLRAAERTYQLLTQVCGRAGRHARPGRALVQTWAPDIRSCRPIAGDRDRFVAVELAERQAVGLPPFGRLAAVILSGPNPEQLEFVCPGGRRGRAQCRRRQRVRTGRRAARARPGTKAKAISRPRREIGGSAGFPWGVAIPVAAYLPHPVHHRHRSLQLSVTRSWAVRGRTID